MSKKIGILTGGGDCPGLNAAIRSVVRHAFFSHNWEVVGIQDGFAGTYEKRFTPLSLDRVRNLLARGGTILGSSNQANPFSYPVAPGENKDVSDACVANVKAEGIEAVVVVGGDGTMSIAEKLMKKGLPVVGIPKTIDNDLEATEYTIGFQTAVEVAVEALDRLHTTAESHDRVIICEVMGRYAGWIALNAGLSTGADIILVPEMDYDVERIFATLHARRAAGSSYSIVVVAEGAKPMGGDYAVAAAGDATREQRLGGAGERLAQSVRTNTDYDVRVSVLGHILRGGTPCAFDRNLATRFGVKAVELIAKGAYGEVAALRSGSIVSSPIEQAVAKLKLVDPKSDLVRAASATGVELGVDLGFG